MKIFYIYLLSAFLVSIGAHAQLSGTYTIDPGAAASAKNYKNFNSAVGDMTGATRSDGGTPNGSGISGAVIFNIADGIYYEHINIPIISGSSGANTITFQSASKDSSKVILNDTIKTDDYVLTITGTYVAFNGISFTRSKGGNVVKIITPARHLAFYHNIFYTTDIYSNCFSDDCDAGSDYRFINNRFENGVYGINFCASPIRPDSGVIISDNIFINVANAINLNRQYNCVITGNRIKGNNSKTAFGIRGIVLYGATLIKNNVIDLQSVNTIEGIFLQYIKGSATGRSLIADNMISLHNSAPYNSSTNSRIYGMEVGLDSFVDIAYNTVLIDSSTSGFSTGMYINNIFSYSNRFYNNNLVNLKGDYALRFTGSINPSDSSDYNNLWADSGLVKWDNKDYNTLALIPAAVPFEKHSLNKKPTFKSPSDLHNATFILNGTGKPFPRVKDDIDGEIRNTLTPDIGADENIVNNEIALNHIVSPLTNICTNKAYNISAIISNNGDLNQASIPVEAEISGHNPQHLTSLYSSGIKPGGKDTVTFTNSFLVSDTGIYKIKVYTSLGSDQNKDNDTTVIFVHAITTTKPSFNIGHACQNNPVQFTNTTKDSSQTYQWLFGDGGSDTAKNPVHTFPQAVSYTTTLRAINAAGCSDTFSKTLTPFPATYTNFTFSSSSSKVQFIPVDTTYNSYFWDFGDGDTSAALKPTHLFRRNNIYSVILVVKNTNGCLDSISELLRIQNAGIADADKGPQGIDVYPDPFTTETVIRYYPRENGPIHISLFDVAGRKIAALVDKNMIAGEYTYILHADNLGLKPGVFYLKCSYDGHTETRKIILVQ